MEKTVEFAESAAAPMTSVLLVKTGLPGWQKILMKVFEDIQGLQFTIDAPNMLMYLSGKVDPLVIIKKLKKAKTHAVLYRIDYGYEENPHDPRKPTDDFMSCTFHVNTEDGGWFKKLLGALKTVQGVSFTIDAASQLGYVCGNINSGVLMKMIAKVGIEVYRIDYGFRPNDQKPNQLLIKSEPEPEPVSRNEMDKKPKKAAETRTEVVTSPNHRSKIKPRSFGRFLVPKFLWTS
ncbi:PREDICTED: uncharacterized protein LOC104807208 [Tarenaya hassleriana]|uniref:uncharacterized protein LOC104807208 n=1 Tax=Tarenaya hassleriana TaxID=28532 RepID=UPI00053C2ACA|nr:PREDICTED: uncharacterized protein LOC104807208 [Tarenaya hassleriana]